MDGGRSSIRSTRSPFISLSIKDVVITLFEAVGLVFLVMLIFLQNWRATLIPTIAVPVVLLGAFAILFVAGFSINTLTMFGMVLAITACWLDDAIVVVENVERLIHTEGLSPKEAARKSMDEITGALVGIGRRYRSVFLPMRLLRRIGRRDRCRQASITIVSSMALSGPDRADLHASGAVRHDPETRHNRPRPRERLRGMVQPQLRSRGVASPAMAAACRGRANRRWVRTLVIYGLIVGAMAVLFTSIPGGFLPDEDQGFLFTQVTLPVGSTAEQTEAVMAKVRKHYLVDEKSNTVAGLFTAAGFGFVGIGQNTGLGFATLKDWSQRLRQAEQRPGGGAALLPAA